MQMSVELKGDEWKSCERLLQQCARDNNGGMIKSGPDPTILRCEYFLFVCSTKEKSTRVNFPCNTRKAKAGSRVFCSLLSEIYFRRRSSDIMSPASPRTKPSPNFALPSAIRYASDSFGKYFFLRCYCLCIKQLFLLSLDVVQ